MSLVELTIFHVSTQFSNRIAIVLKLCGLTQYMLVYSHV